MNSQLRYRCKKCYKFVSSKTYRCICGAAYNDIELIETTPKSWRTPMFIKERTHNRMKIKHVN